VSEISLGNPSPETILDPVPEAWSDALAEALASLPTHRRDAVAAVCARYPRYLAAWAELAALGRDETETYAYARVGYHRGLDTLRGSGWRGTGYVRWEHETNRGFLSAVAALEDAAAAIGEAEEAERCRVFIHQLDPSWRR
jgi:hypothetical protein